MTHLRDLAELGVPRVTVAAWIEAFNAGGEDWRDDFALTDLQAAALAQQQTLDGSGNLLIAGPTSAGKTLVAEAIVATTLARLEGAKAIYLVPLRALVTEKYERFARVLPNRRVLPVSSDYPSSDRLIDRGEWDLAIVVFDKLYQWLANPRKLPQLHPTLEAVLIDELQVIGDQSRGEKLEMILSILLWYQESLRQQGKTRKPRLIGMIASTDAAEPFSRWWNALIVPESPVRRPVPLYQGWLDQWGSGALYTDMGRDKLVASEEYPKELVKALASVKGRSPRSQPLKRDDLVVSVVKGLVGQGFRVLIYVARKHEAEQIAIRMRKALTKGGSTSFQATLPATLRPYIEDLDESPTVDLLGMTMDGRVAFHHGDMLPAERRLVEQAFLHPGPNPPVTVVVATPTLGMGINLPADAVVMRDLYTFSIVGEEAIAGLVSTSGYEVKSRPLSVLEYRNFAGRAGRYGPDSSSGRYGVCLSVRLPQDVKLVDNLLHDPVPPLTSRLTRPLLGLAPHVLMVSSCLSEVKSRGGIEEVVDQVMACTYASALDPKGGNELRGAVHSAIEQLQRLGFITPRGLSGPGRALAQHHLSLSTGEELVRMAPVLRRLWPVRRFEVLYLLASLPEAQLVYPAISDLPSTPEERRRLEQSARAFVVERIGHSYFSFDSTVGHFAVGTLRWPSGLSNHAFASMLRAIAAWGWIEGLTAHRLVESDALPRVTLGDLRKVGEQLAELAEALREVWEQVEAVEVGPWEQRMSRQLWLLGQALRHGVPFEALPLPLIVSFGSRERLTRTTYLRTWSALGGSSDIRPWLGKEAPVAVERPVVWRAIQDGLRWWTRAAGRGRNEENEANSLVASLQELASGTYLHDFRGPESTGPPDSNRLFAIAGLDLRQYSALIDRARAIVEQNSDLESEASLRKLTEIALRPSPLLVELRRLGWGADGRWIARIGDVWANLTLMPGVATEQRLEGPLRGRQQSDHIVVCGRAWSIDMVKSFAGNRKVRMAITIEALLTGSLLVQQQPRHGPRLLKVLLTRGLCINSFDVLLTEMFSARRSVGEGVGGSSDN